MFFFKIFFNNDDDDRGGNDGSIEMKINDLYDMELNTGLSARSINDYDQNLIIYCAA